MILIYHFCLTENFVAPSIRKVHHVPATDMKQIKLIHYNGKSRKRVILTNEKPKSLINQSFIHIVDKNHSSNFWFFGYMTQYLSCNQEFVHISTNSAFLKFLNKKSVIVAVRRYS